MNLSEKSRDSLNFIEVIIEEDLASGKHDGKVLTRFPPEPNGFLHIGHVKAITINFDLAAKYGGLTNLRFDDTNPSSEDTEYVEAIKEDIKWLGYQWNGKALYASDYFPNLYAFAIDLIEKGLAYVDDSTPYEMAEMKGTPTSPGKLSPYRNRPIEENLRLFKGMKEGEYPDGSRVLRAKIDMSSPNMHMRDPVMYRIKHEHHHRTGDEWCIYPMYDFAHGQSDSIEGITHSLCSLEFRHHRPLYDWFIEKLGIFPSRQIEFARMNVAYMITSKRRLLKLVEQKYVDGWDDPRMSTVSGLRRRGYLPQSLRRFAVTAGVAKRDNVIEMGLLESILREDLNAVATRVMVVLDPVRVTIDNYPEGKTETLTTENNPGDANAGMHDMEFSNEIFIERSDFMEDPPKKYFRLAPGKYVRLKNAYIIKAERVVKDDAGNIQTIHCSYVPESKSGSDTSGIKVKGTIHWVDAHNHLDITVRLYDRLFTDPTPTSHEEKDFMEFLNPDSLVTITHAKAERYLAGMDIGQPLQFMRKGYFVKDRDSSGEQLVFNRTVTLRDTWAKIQKQQKK